jgi:hypothetical protein
VLSFALMLAVVLGTGCASSTAKGPAGRELTLVRPAHQTLRRGETNRVDIVLLRENIPTNVGLQFSELPRGVKVVEADRKVKPDEVIVTYTLFAANDADLVSNHQAKVTAEGPDGLRATESLAMTIKQ